MKLIIDSGATKADWCLLGSASQSSEVRRFKTDGMNFSTMSEESVEAIVNQALAVLGSEGVREVFLYAAGLIEGSEQYDTSRRILSRAFPDAEVFCASDMLAAARAACGKQAGIAAILGTGSNSCLYDGETIVSNVRSGGFILGDEGGGACLGKLFISDFIKGLVPQDLSDEFSAEFDADYMTIVRKVYRETAPSAYLGSFAPWILARCGEEGYLHDLVMNNLESFFDRSLLRHGRNDIPVGFVGGFAAACESMIREIASKKGMKLSRIISSPMEGLILYHSN